CAARAGPPRCGIEVGAASARCRHPPGRQLPRIEREIPEPLRRRAGPGAIVDLAIRGDVRVLGADAAALALVDLPERAGHDQGTAAGLGTRPVGADRVI